MNERDFAAAVRELLRRRPRLAADRRRHGIPPFWRARAGLRRRWSCSSSSSRSRWPRRRRPSTGSPTRLGGRRRPTGCSSLDAELCAGRVQPPEDALRPRARLGDRRGRARPRRRRRRSTTTTAAARSSRCPGSARGRPTSTSSSCSPAPRHVAGRGHRPAGGGAAGARRSTERPSAARARGHRRGVAAVTARPPPGSSGTSTSATPAGSDRRRPACGT